MVKTLIKSERYDGQYVALKEFDSHRVISHGKTPQEAHKNAVTKGCKDPVIVFVPTKGMAQIY